ncbi:MAG: hypothetical protein V4573_04640 [Pseudomonadota bacterium]
MKHRLRFVGMSLFTKALLVMILGVSLTAWSETTWKEEVQLHDDQKIIATRTVERGGRSELGQQAPIKHQSLAFALPATNEQVVWQDKFAEDIGGANFLPMQLGLYQGSAYVVAYPMGCLSYNKWGRPNPPYVVFKYQSRSWQRIPLQELPAVLTAPNLIFSSPDTEAKKLGHSLISAEEIMRLNSVHTQPEHRTIRREPIKTDTFQSLVICDEMVFYKGTWVGPGDSIGKRMMDRRSK